MIIEWWWKKNEFLKEKIFPKINSVEGNSVSEENFPTLNNE